MRSTLFTCVRASCETIGFPEDVIAVEFSPDVISAARESFFVDAVNNQSCSIAHEYLYAENGRYIRSPTFHESSQKSKGVLSSLSLVQSCAFSWIDTAPKDAADIIIVDLESGLPTVLPKVINCACKIARGFLLGFPLCANEFCFNACPAQAPIT